MYKRKTKADIFCPIDYGLRILSGKWKSRIICVLWQLQPLRYSNLRCEMADITDAALSNALRELENSGLIRRHQYNEVPLRVEYELTARGKSAVPLLLAIADWAGGDMPADRRSDLPLCSQCRYQPEEDRG